VRPWLAWLNRISSAFLLSYKTSLPLQDAILQLLIGFDGAGEQPCQHLAKSASDRPISVQEKGAALRI